MGQEARARGCRTRCRQTVLQERAPVSGPLQDIQSFFHTVLLFEFSFLLSIIYLGLPLSPPEESAKKVDTLWLSEEDQERERL